MKGLNVRPETIKIQEENISSIPFDRSLSSFVVFFFCFFFFFCICLLRQGKQKPKN